MVLGLIQKLLQLNFRTGYKVIEKLFTLAYS